MTSSINAGKLILIVDDFRDIIEVYKHYLTQEGFRVAVAYDGQEAVDKTHDLHPDLVLMDLSLPIVNGWAATRQLKEHEETRHIPIVILTAYGSEGTLAVIREGCDGFLMKPTEPEELLKEIRRVIQRAADKARLQTGCG